MNPIAIKYYPIKSLNIGLTAKGALPQSWEEVTPRQIIAIACTVNQSISEVSFLSALTGISKWVIAKLDNYQRFQLSEALNFFSAIKLHNAFAIPFVQIKFTKYYTPKPKLKGISFGQFIFIDTWFGNYQHENKNTSLHQFLAALCVPSRKAFNEEDIELNAKKMATLIPEQKEALVVNYMLIKAWLIKTYPLVFPEAKELTSNNQQATSNQQQATSNQQQVFDSSVWIKIFDAMVGDNITERDKYAALPVHTVLRYLSKNIKENMKRKK